MAPRRAQPLLLLSRSNPPTEGGGTKNGLKNERPKAGSVGVKIRFIGGGGDGISDGRLRAPSCYGITPKGESEDIIVRFVADKATQQIKWGVLLGDIFVGSVF